MARTTETVTTSSTGTGVRDAKAPAALKITVTDGEGREWGALYATTKNFATGSVGFYANGKLTNPGNPESRYQAGLTFTLVGSKPQG
jgi:hypothetical protein